MSKRLVVCCDGTWNTPEQECDGRPCPTNVTKVSRAVAPSDDSGVEQRVHYQLGVGTSKWERIRGGAFGMGLSRGVKDVYGWVVDNYEPGDELFLFGFSRGAYMARSTAGLIRNSGVLRRDEKARIDEAYTLYRKRRVHPNDRPARDFRAAHSHDPVPIAFVGVWDTVGALGIPWSGVGVITWFNRRWQFHDTRLSRTIESAYQALAIDEARKPFLPAIWEVSDDAAGQAVEQVWFAGVHSDVGGGYAETGLADLAMLWMVERAESRGLRFSPDAFRDGEQRSDGDVPTRPDPLGVLHDSRKGVYRVLPPARRGIGETSSGRESVAASAVTRTQRDAAYRPGNLMQYLSGPHRLTPLPQRAEGSADAPA